MLSIRKSHKFEELLASTFHKLVLKIDNTGNSDPAQNGEFSLVKALSKQFARSEPIVFFDVGANVGKYTEYLLENCEAVTVTGHLFEPQQTCFTELQQKFESDDRIILNKFGLSDTNSKEEIFKDKDGSGLASLYKRNLSHHNLTMDQTEEIELQTAKSYVESHGITKINLLKIDVEGHEISALTGFGDFLTPKNVDVIQFEYGGANLDSHTSLQELFEFFQVRGFALCKVMKSHLRYTPTYDSRYENFTYQNWVAINPQKIK